MNGRVELAAHQSDRLVPLFAIVIANGWQDHMVFSFKNLDTERQPQPVLEAAGFVLGRVELELEFHTVTYVIHI